MPVRLKKELFRTDWFRDCGFSIKHIQLRYERQQFKIIEIGLRMRVQIFCKCLMLSEKKSKTSDFYYPKITYFS